MENSGITRRTLIGSSLSVAAGFGLASPAQAHPGHRTAEAATRFGRVRGRREDGSGGAAPEL